MAAILAPRAADLPRIAEEYRSALARVESPDPARFTMVSGGIDTPFGQLSRMLFSDKLAENRSTRLLGWILGVAFLFMLLPTVNLVNISVSRILERASEIGVRKAFGASSRTLVGQFLVENVMLTLVGSAIGLLASLLALRLLTLSALIPYTEFAMNYRIFGFAVIVALLFGVLSGCLPGMAYVAAASCRSSARRWTMTGHLLKMVWNRRRNNALLSVEIFFSFLVLFLVAVFAVYFADNYRQPLGFDYQNVLNVGLRTNQGDIKPGDEKAQNLRDGAASQAMLRELASMPEVESAGGAWSEVYSHSQWNDDMRYKNLQLSGLPRLWNSRHVQNTAPPDRTRPLVHHRGRWCAVRSDRHQPQAGRGPLWQGRPARQTRGGWTSRP